MGPACISRIDTATPPHNLYAAFVNDMMREAEAGQRGCAMWFGPGLTAETTNFHVI